VSSLEVEDAVEVPPVASQHYYTFLLLHNTQQRELIITSLTNTNTNKVKKTGISNTRLKRKKKGFKSVAR